MIQLRDYQQNAVSECREEFRNGARKVLLVAPTGSGKTVIFSFIAQAAAIERGKKVLICAHREELLAQISRTLEGFGIAHGWIASNRQPDHANPVQLASVMTLKRRSVSWIPDLIIMDEAHHCVAGSWLKIIERWPTAQVLGVTATPARLDGRGLGEVFECLVMGPTVKGLIEQGHLCPVKYYTPKLVDTHGLRARGGDFNEEELENLMMQSRVTGEVVGYYRKLSDAKPAVAFCTTIKHSEHVADAFNAAGYRWKSLDSSLSTSERRQAVRDLATGELHGISSCDIISEGFDLPCVTTAILLRPTQSLSLHLQQVGRVLRPAEGKDFAIIIDHVGNTGSSTDGTITPNHGRAEDDRDWTLDGIEKKQPTKAESKMCKECFAMIPVSATSCPECKADLTADVPLPDEDKEGELEEFGGTPASLVYGSEEWLKKASLREVLRWARTREQLVQVQELRGYKKAWVYYTELSRGNK
jgi:DNA repair protein RadD